MLVRKLFRTAWQYKSQFISMVVMVAIGMGVFLGFNIEWKSIEEDTGAFFSQTKYADYRLYSETGFTEEEIKAVQAIDGVDAATRFLDVNVNVKDTQLSLALMVSENAQVSILYHMSGKAYEEGSDGIWLSDQFAEKNGIAIGDTLTMVYKDIQITGEVVGLCKSGERMICTADSNQLMPDYERFGFAYITPQKLKESLGIAFYPQINIISGMEKEALEEAVRKAVGRTIMVVAKEDHISYAGALSEAEEGKTTGSILPVLFLAIGILTMVTTMHRIAANEKTQIGTLKALGFRDRRILWHYTSYGFVIGLAGTVIGTALGYLVAAIIISPGGMMGTYFDMPDWSLIMPVFCVPVLVFTVIFLTLISYLSVKKMLRGTAADTLRPYTPKAMKQSVFEKLPFWEKLPFGTKWNFRDVIRHKARSAMTLIGVIGCTMLLVGGLGMRETMVGFVGELDKTVCHYVTKISLAEESDNEAARRLADEQGGSWASVSGISYEGKTVVLEIYQDKQENIRFLDSKNGTVSLSDDGVYLCRRLKGTAAIGDEIKFSPYGSEEVYTVKVAGYLRSIMTENIVMSEAYAERIGIPYHITTVYTDKAPDEVEASAFIAGKQEKSAMLKSYDSFMSILNVMVALFIIGAVILGVVVLYNLGVMSYVERRRELATLKVLGFRDKKIGNLLISQNIWLTVIGVLLGLPAGAATLEVSVLALAKEYELKVCIGALTYIVSIGVTFGVSVAVGFMVAGKNKKIDMVEALKNS